MCGIVGFVNREHLPSLAESRTILARMCGAIRHRGPDDEGTSVTTQRVWGMRRLAIIDLAGGQQPLSGCTPDTSIIFNGEIYNFVALQQELTARGHRFATHSDTETIVHAYEEYGAECVRRLRGMFAFAVWDEARQRLFIARDRVGKKPLYYTTTPDGTFVFASELKALLVYPGVGREMDAAACDAYLSFGYVPDPLCILRGIHKLAPGHTLTYDAAGVRVAPYWDFNFTPRTDWREDDCAAQLRAHLTEAVRVRLRADVPLGAFLSGGVDSSAVVGLMTQLMGRRVKTFSIGFHEDYYNELAFARQAARHFDTEHYELVITPDVSALVNELVWHLDEPFADSSALPTYLVSKLAREHVTVALSGDGGDELFAGYERYLPRQWQSGWGQLPAAFRQGVMQRLGRHLPHGVWGRNYIHDAAFAPLERYIENVACFSQLAKRSLYGDFLRRHAPAPDAAPQCFRALVEAAGISDPNDALLYLDCKTYLPGDILTKVDRVSMAVSLEVRSPLLDQELIDFATQIPFHLKLKNGQAKHIFKRAVADLVPPEILNRPKQGFAIPLREWLRQQMRDEMRQVLTEPRTRQRGYFNPQYVNLLLDEHQRGRRDHSFRLWSLFMLELWHRQFLDTAPGFACAPQPSALVSSQITA